jgi:hypothetical protein
MLLWEMLRRKAETIFVIECNVACSISWFALKGCNYRHNKVGLMRLAFLPANYSAAQLRLTSRDSVLTEQWMFRGSSKYRLTPVLLALERASRFRPALSTLLWLQKGKLKALHRHLETCFQAFNKPKLEAGNSIVLHSCEDEALNLCFGLGTVAYQLQLEVIQN